MHCRGLAIKGRVRKLVTLKLTKSTVGHHVINGPRGEDAYRAVTANSIVHTYAVDVKEILQEGRVRLSSPYIFLH